LASIHRASGAISVKSVAVVGEQHLDKILLPDQLLLPADTGPSGKKVVLNFEDIQHPADGVVNDIQDGLRAVVESWHWREDSRSHLTQSFHAP